MFLTLILAASTAVVDPVSFANPPDDCRPRCWWAWMNGNVSKEGIARDLAEMAKIGIGGAKKPDDCVWWENDWRAGLLKEIPTWVKEDKPSPTGRHTFSIVRHYKGNEPLLPAGLLGPVRLIAVE